MARIWGNDWRTLMNDLLPPFPAETFLRELSIYARKIPWNIAEPYFRSQIRKRLAIPYTKKYRWLTIRDITGKGTAGTKKRRTRVIPKGILPPTSSDLTLVIPKALPPTSTTTSYPNSPAQSTSQSSPLTSLPPTQPSSPSNDLIEGSSSGTMQSHDVQDLALRIQQVGKGKRRRLNIQENIRPRYKVEIPIINLDVEERIQEIEKEREREQDEEKIKDISAVVMAAKGLQLDVRDEQGRINKKRLEKRLERLIEIFLAHVDISID